MAFTLLKDFEAYTGQAYTAGQRTRLTTLLTRAERDITRKVGGTAFYVAAERAIKASVDWIEATCFVTEFYFLNDDPDDKAAAVGPYSSERIGDYSYTVRTRRDVFRELELRRILAPYISAAYAAPDHFQLAYARKDRAETTEVPE